MERRGASPHQAIQVVTQFAEDYSMVEEKLALCEQELEEVNQACNHVDTLNIGSFSLQVKESREAVQNSILDLCKSLKEFQVMFSLVTCVSMCCPMVRTSQDGIDEGLTGALHQLLESLQKTCSEDENVKKLLVSARMLPSITCHPHAPPFHRIF